MRRTSSVAALAPADELEVTLRRRRDTGEYEETLRSCPEKVERLAILTKELTLARLDAEQGRPAPAQVVRLGSVLDGAVRRLAGEAEKRGVTVALHPSQALSLSVRCGEGLADLVFTNVLDNAVKFSPPGGGWWSMPRPKARGGRRGLRRGAGDPGRGDLRVFERLLPRDA
jgi:signal transduction histidine kinase